MQVMKRIEAIHQGLVKYVPDTPCRAGHRLRYASTGQCIGCAKDAQSELMRIRNSAEQARSEKDALIIYRLHPQDLAQALAFCQALDLQRGRVPQGNGGPAQLPAPRLHTAEEQADAAAKYARLQEQMDAEVNPPDTFETKEMRGWR